VQRVSVLIRLGLVLQPEKWRPWWDFRSATQRLHGINARDCILSLLEAVMLADMQRQITITVRAGVPFAIVVASVLGVCM
jgi:hypothetical protein